MPAAVLQVNWEAVKTLALAVGVRESARRLGISVDAVRQRCTREGWIRSLPRSQPLPPTVREPAMSPVAKVSFLDATPHVASVASLSPSDVMAAELADLSSGSRLSLSRAVRRGAAHAEQLDPDDIIERADKLASLVKSAATLGGWADVSAVPVVNVAFLSAGADDRRTRNIESVEVDAQVVEDQGA